MTSHDSHHNEQPILLTTLGEGGWLGAAQLVGVKGSIATVDSIKPIETGATVRLDLGYALILGACRDCHPRKSQFQAEIAIEQIIPTPSDVAKLMAAVCAATPRRTVPGTVASPVESHVRK